MAAVTQLEADVDVHGSYALHKLDRDAIPHRHPVAVFDRAYWKLSEGHLLPDESKLLMQPETRELMRWVQHIEPVEIDGLVDFYVIGQGEAVDLNSGDHLREGWISETIDEEFVESRYYEAVTASILRKPMYSRGAVPSIKRAFINQYRGVFPMFADTHARLRLAIIAAETYVEIDDAE